MEMDTITRIRRMKDIYAELYDISKEEESTVIGIKICEDERLDGLFYENKVYVNKFVDSSLKELNKDELVQIIAELMNNSMCKYFITRRYLEK